MRILAIPARRWWIAMAASLTAVAALSGGGWVLWRLAPEFDVLRGPGTLTLRIKANVALPYQGVTLPSRRYIYDDVGFALPYQGLTLPEIEPIPAAKYLYYDDSGLAPVGEAGEPDGSSGQEAATACPIEHASAHSSLPTP